MFIPKDPEADDKLAQKGHGKANPSIIVSQALPLADAPDAYKHFNNRDHGWTKVILHPNAP